MNWFYMEDEKEKGPFSKDEFQNLINERVITAQTPVRKEDAVEWKPLKAFAKSQSSSAENKSSDDHAENIGGTDTDHYPDEKESDLKTCSQCGRSFPEDQVIAFDDRIICADCKPDFVQRLKEGASINTAFQYGGFWVRFGAKIIDWLILMVVQYIIFIPLGMIGLFNPSANSPEMMNSPAFFMSIGLQQIVGLAIPLAYSTFFLGRFGATIGKMACKLKVVTPEGGKISYLRAFGRHFAEILSGIILLIGYIMAAFDSEKRSLHDRICSTRVVRK